MNGSTLLNYARFRDDDEADWSYQRQQQVLTAVLQQIKDPTKLFTGSEALGKVFAMTSTNVPLYLPLLTNGLSFLDGAQNGIEKLTIPELGDWVDAYDVYGGLGSSGRSKINIK